MSLLKCLLRNEKYQSPSMKNRLIPYFMSNFSRASISCCDKVKDEAVMEGFYAMARFIDLAGRWKETLVNETFLLERLRLWCGTSRVARTLCDLG